MDKPKRPPPVPKFEGSDSKADMEEKVMSFMSSIKAEPPPVPASEELLKKDGKPQ
jgi:hypothetical protein